MSLEILNPFSAIVHEVLGAFAKSLGVFAKSLGPWNECLDITIFVLISTSWSVIHGSP